MADNTLHSSARANWLERRFALRSRGGTLRTECLAGITGFLAAAYLLVVIPGLLAIGGMDKGAATTGTILVFVVGSLLMAFYANLPFIVGPGIGGSVLVGVTLAGSEGIGWQTGLGIACWSGILFFLLTRFGLREVVTRSVPQSIKLGLTASIGLFVAVLGFRNAGLVLANAKTNALMLGDFLAPGALVALCGLFLAIALQARKVPGAILWAILCATLVGIPFGVTKLPTHFIDAPHSLAPVLGQVDLLGALNIAFLPFLFVFFASEFFSTMGTTQAVGPQYDLDYDQSRAMLTTLNVGPTLDPRFQTYRYLRTPEEPVKRDSPRRVFLMVMWGIVGALIGASVTRLALLVVVRLQPEVAAGIP